MSGSCANSVGRFYCFDANPIVQDSVVLSSDEYRARLCRVNWQKSQPKLGSPARFSIRLCALATTLPTGGRYGRSVAMRKKVKAGSILVFTVVCQLAASAREPLPSVRSIVRSALRIKGSTQAGFSGKVASYLSGYWQRRGHPRFFRDAVSNGIDPRPTDPDSTIASAAAH
jgi:hypothetical protein